MRLKRLLKQLRDILMGGFADDATLPDCQASSRHRTAERTGLVPSFAWHACNIMLEAQDISVMQPMGPAYTQSIFRIPMFRVPMFRVLMAWGYRR